MKPAQHAPRNTPRATRMRGAKCRCETELGTEKRCSVCGFWWPADREFFCSNTSKCDGLADACKACMVERQRRARGDGPPPAPVPEVFTAMCWGAEMNAPNQSSQF